jgi:hypothetical protein
LKFPLVAVVALFLIACSATESTVSSSSRTNPPADTQAANLRTQLNLLMSEQVMIIAKESESAAFQTQALMGYAHLLDVNGGEIALIVRNAFGTRSAEEFYVTWQALNRDLVEYGTGLVTHNQAMAEKFGSDLTNNFVPHFTQLVNRLTDLDPALITQLMTHQVTATKAAIDDVAAGNFSKLYVDLHTAYTSTFALSDALAKRIAQKYPDKFPGDPSSHSVDFRVSVNTLLQEHSYVATMATNAAVGKRPAESAAATIQLAANTDSLDAQLKLQAKALWIQRDTAAVAYATNAEASAKQALTDVFVTQFSTLARVPASAVTNQVSATIKVIDDQRGQSFKPLADDDRTAATAMQPVADALASVQR